jgi:hypothetical protein
LRVRVLYEMFIRKFLPIDIPEIRHEFIRSCRDLFFCDFLIILIHIEINPT